MGELMKGIHLIDGIDYLSVFLLECENRLVLFDTGFNRKDGPKIVEYIEKLGKPLSLILITHHHVDHVANIKKIRTTTGSKLAFHELEASLIRAEPDFLLEDGMKLSPCEMEVIHLPGHTPGNISIYLPYQKAIMIGDSIFDENGLIPPPKMYCTDFEQAKTSIQKLLTYDFTTLFLSHGRPMVQEAYAAVENLVNSLREAKN
ncbi:MAG: MBL fold metallo-hydrolase [Promethearchaeota archaeon]|nr:MAG: MBL fold metallo-hydrolase [Candidatus Lokiarchaeota archaeon]